MGTKSWRNQQRKEAKKICEKQILAFLKGKH